MKKLHTLAMVIEVALAHDLAETDADDTTPDPGGETMRPVVIPAILVCALGAACATSREPTPTFPTRAELGRIARTPPPSEADDRESVEVATWQLAGPLPAGSGQRPSADVSPWTALLREVAASREGLALVSEDMQCVAREIGRFELEHDAPPAPDLRDFILARCGSTGVHARTLSWSSEADEGASEEEFLARHRARIVEQLRRALGDDAALAGLWVGRRGRRVVMQLAAARRGVRLDGPVPPPDARGEVVLRGELLEPAARIEVLANRGRFDVVTCRLAPSVGLPRFVATCPVERDGAGTRIEVSAWAPERVLGHSVLSVVVGAHGASTATFTRAASPLPPATATDPSGALVTLLNGVRQRAGLAPVELAREQARTVCQVAPHYLAASAGRLPANVADTVALGLMAGWEVDGLIRDGRFFADFGAPSRALGDWLARALDYPSARRVLLDRDTAQVAPCPALSERGAVRGTVWASYALFDHAEIRTDLNRFLQRVVQLRAREGLSAPLYDDDLAPAIDQNLRQILEPDADPSDVLRLMLTEASRVSSQSVDGWVLSARSPETVEVPAALLAEPHLTIALGGLYRRAPGDAWGHLTLFVLATRGNNPNRAVSR